MTHAAKIITEELAYLRNLHGEATAAGKTIIANSIASDIADLVNALEVVERRDASGPPVEATVAFAPQAA